MSPAPFDSNEKLNNKEEPIQRNTNITRYEIGSSHRLPLLLAIGLLIISLGTNIGLIVRLVQQKPVLSQFEERNLRHGWQKGKLRHQLNLNEKQLKAIEAMHETTWVKTAVIRETLELKRAALINQLKESLPDKAKIQGLVEEIAKLQAQIELGITENILIMKKELTPEQQQQFFKLFSGSLKGRKMFKIPLEESGRRNSRYHKRPRKGGHNDY